jgi:hypothetical protein
MGYDRSWLTVPSSDDADGRAIWALGWLLAHGDNGTLQSIAGELMSAVLPNLERRLSLRGLAFAILGLVEAEGVFWDDSASRVRRDLAARLHGALREAQDADWPWFEPILAYDNARLCHALIASANNDSDSGMLRSALYSLEWLVSVQTDHSGRFAPVGSEGFYPRNGARARWDQQPLEAWATVEACLAAEAVSGQRVWRSEAERANGWFWGKNALGAVMVDPETDGCYDGLTPDGPNLNQGAESSISLVGASIAMSEAVLERKSVWSPFWGVA